MYRLLPEALEYFESSPELKGNYQLANIVLISSYILGILICAGFNAVIHALTSQSVVHCVHEGEEGDNHGDHDHDHDVEEPARLYDEEYRISSANKHSHNIRHHHHRDDDERAHHNQHSLAHSHSNLHSHSHADLDRSKSADFALKSASQLHPADGHSQELAQELACSSSSSASFDEQDETSPLLENMVPIATIENGDGEAPEITNVTTTRPRLPTRKISLLDITHSTLRGQKSMGLCMGYASIEQCLYSKCCDINEGDDNSRLQTIVLPPIDEAHHDMYRQNLSGQLHRSASRQSVHSNHSEHPQYHHHHVISEYSQLFSIGIQTALAITLHKIPEGILTFATYHADKSLGFSVFLALAIHNFSEGFTIVFPLYLATRNRLVAFSIAALLGGISQPLGAVIAWFFFRNKFTNESTSLTFGLIVSLTAGFMSIIGLQMYGTSITFGGQQQVTLAWAFAGVTLVGVSACLI
ncbi:Zn(2+) transporter ZRT3 [Sugiyamaella lignohabitans]|uniref:Zn(2+) transporter ZRT3 n=1 Tax=Sugiyamaella lignohabitans TaxID=796027 RepID=A0A167FHD5_9ASCO|nr:Zn(2+) transporter ZRT3 [Sugiyamaella lignohabitans]ANB15301.1 Zn(2+) transporter ZRT3 [Sugiyamaella lignohabitans]